MNNFSKLGLFKSKGRLFSDAQNSYRTPFQRDRDRIVHCASFRRLKHKTQVFVNTEGDHYRTRITHSIEVAQIARTISKYLYLNDDLAETLALLMIWDIHLLDMLVKKLWMNVCMIVVALIITCKP